MDFLLGLMVKGGGGGGVEEIKRHEHVVLQYPKMHFKFKFTYLILVINVLLKIMCFNMWL